MPEERALKTNQCRWLLVKCDAIPLHGNPLCSPTELRKNDQWDMTFVHQFIDQELTEDLIGQ